MSFKELLLNLLGTKSKWSIVVEIGDRQGIIHIHGGKIIKAKIEGEENLSGIEAIKFLISRENEIKDVNLLPFDKLIEKEINIDQMEFFSLISGSTEKSSENRKLKINQEETINELEKEIPILKLLEKYFHKENIQLIYSSQGSIFSNLEESKEIKNIVQAYLEIFRNSLQYENIIFHFSNSFGIFLIKKEKFLLILIDNSELSNFGLDEPEILENLNQFLEKDDYIH
ncbi:hypothetical protein Dester_1503 [Desulfurobacterium thermolithotrophum DSM 11699]|uniref:Uncharacterized protein n=1 Tax=Desulfurobacterium thermolithotrophum (strain DSM 11699 / BSA) TaxID=868864 RepID=F0S2B5_DESTD|nr:hypothetical protein [Desulfurobacterium thermolithotrophum]ADY74130.1 hypothetical protein Dester_1503 [Desulfurobacterium thermolithotrophum DSM 11699]